MIEKFKLETKKEQIVYMVDVNIRSTDSMNNKCSMNPHGIFVKELKIVHQTKYKIVLSDDFVTVLDRMREDQKKDSYHHTLEDVLIWIKSNETFWANGIFSTTYTLRDPNKMLTEIKRKITAKINKDYGFLRFADIESIIEGMEIINK